MRTKNIQLIEDLQSNYHIYPASYFADKYDMNIYSIYTMCSKMKLTTLHRLEKDKKEIIKDYKNGCSLSELKRKYGHDRSNIRKFLEKNGCKIKSKSEIKRIFTINHDFFEKIDNHTKAYLLGFLYADGCVYENRLQIALNKKDIEILNNFKKYMKSNHNLYDDRTNIRFQLHSDKLCQDLEKLGYIPRKSLTLKFPTGEQVPKKYINSFLLGYFDGDGCIQFRIFKNKLGYVEYKWSFGLISTFEFLNESKKILDKVMQKNGIISKETRSKENVWYLDYRGGFKLYKSRKPIKLLYNFLYKNIKFSLKRKKNKFLENK